ncbi:MAG: [FeFe] hydrogenase H-cluster radical SAM maturase HydE [Thermoguttaceae bacterium]
MEHKEILSWLQDNDETRLADLWRMADNVRQRNVGGEVYLRGLIEFSNYCTRLCKYCGLRAANTGLTRYRMPEDEILQCARQAVSFGYGTVVLQSGEDPGVTADWMGGVIRRIKAETSLAITLSLGERTDDDYLAWKKAGADRYLLRFETSNRALYDEIHPPRAGGCSDRIALLRRLREIGYEAGSGVMIGIPGQSYDDLARDIELFGELNLDMIGVGPYLPHPATPLGDPQFRSLILDGAQVPNDELTTYKVIALARMVCPRANIPSTTALATLNTSRGRELGLVRGANVVMPNLTPAKYRIHYEIYPNKACIRETADTCHHCIQGRIASIGRAIGRGRGDSPNYCGRVNSPVAQGGP